MSSVCIYMGLGVITLIVCVSMYDIHNNSACWLHRAAEEGTTEQAAENVEVTPGDPFKPITVCVCVCVCACVCVCVCVCVWCMYYVCVHLCIFVYDLLARMHMLCVIGCMYSHLTDCDS